MPVTSPRQEVPHRYRQLDGLRGLAALCVFVSHCFLIVNPHGNWVHLTEASPLGIFFNGRAAVMFFFVLSGFVLSLPFINNERPLRLTEFYLKRIFRIHPAYLLAIVVAILLKTYVFHESGMRELSGWIKEFWNWHWDKPHLLTILKTFVLVGPNFDADMIDPVIWSLVVEMKMSFLLPLFIMIVSRGNRLFNALFFLLLLALIYNHQTGYLGVFYIGTLCAKYKSEITRLLKSLNLVWIVALLAFAVFCYNIRNEFYKPYGDIAHPFAYFWRDYVNAIGSALIMMLAISRRRLADFFQTPFFNFLGDISYSFYLLHTPILIVLCSLITGNDVGSLTAIFSLALITTTALSYLVFRFVEIPFQTMAKKLVAKHKVLQTLSVR